VVWTPVGVFAFSKRQLQQPARDQLAVRDGDDAAVLALWLEQQTRESIAGYLTALKSRPRAKSQP
jgi:hypothetical protein